jgi:hypothetical protein
VFADYWKAGSYTVLLVLKREQKPGAVIPRAKEKDPSVLDPFSADMKDPTVGEETKDPRAADVQDPKRRERANRVIEVQDPKPRETATRATELWAALSVPKPLCRQDEVASDKFAIQFCIVNDSPRIVNPEFGSSQLFVNGKELKDWPVIIANGPRDNRWKGMAPGGHLRFSYGLQNYFKEPGVYKVMWKGKNFQSPEIVFRVLPR